VTIEKEVREYLTHIYLCPKARYDKYLPLLDQKRGDWWGWFTTETQPDWIVLSVSFADEQLQNRFMAEPDVICLPHQTESAPCCSATVSKLAEMGLADAPTTSTEAFLDWAIENGHSVGSFTDQLQRRARLRVLRHSQARLAKSASVGESV
jgi:hypothetical protein